MTFMNREIDAKWQEWCVAQTTRTVNLLPTIIMGGWNGSPTGWMPYVDWRKEWDLTVALIDMFSQRSSEARDAIRREIVNMFYGGEEGIQMMIKSKAKQMPSLLTTEK